MPTFEVVAAEPARDSGTTTMPPATERTPKVRRFHALSLKDHARLLLPFLGMGVLGGVAKLQYPYWWLAPDLVSFLANVFIVTAVLGVLLELFSAKLLVEKVSEDLAQRVIGRGLPPELQASIRDINVPICGRRKSIGLYIVVSGNGPWPQS